LVLIGDPEKPIVSHKTSEIGQNGGKAGVVSEVQDGQATVELPQGGELKKQNQSQIQINR